MSGTEGIGHILSDALQARGFDVVAVPVDEVRRVDLFDAVIVGGALYGNRWPLGARRFLRRHQQRLRSVPVWFFSSGPLDDSADQRDIPPVPQVAVLAERIGAKGHVMFGGRLESGVKGFPASAMAKTKSGDWRNADRIRAWAAELANILPTATPGTPVEHAAASVERLLMHAGVGWLLCAVTMAALLQVVSLTAALVLHAIAAPLYFTAVARHYFRAPGARDPLPTAIAFTGVVILLDVVIIAGVVLRSDAMFRSIVGSWLPFLLIFLAVWTTGLVMSMMPAAPRRTART